MKTVGCMQHINIKQILACWFSLIVMLPPIRRIWRLTQQLLWRIFVVSFHWFASCLQTWYLDHLLIQRYIRIESLIRVRAVRSSFLLLQYCVLPLGSQPVHETQPIHLKSVLLTGPQGVGKKMLVNAIAYELGVGFFFHYYLSFNCFYDLFAFILRMYRKTNCFPDIFSLQSLL